MVTLNEENLVELEEKQKGNEINSNELHFITKSITNVQPNLFDKFNLLRILHLSDNAITEIPNGLFNQLSELEIISLHSNQITELANNVFESNTKLKEIYLQFNNIEFLASDIFRNLSELIEISIFNNKIKELGPNIFETNTKLQTLKLHINNIEHLHPDVIRNLPELFVLNLGQNKLTTFDFKSLKESPKLKSLALNDNNLSKIANFDMHKIWWKNLSDINLQNNLMFCSELKTIHSESDKTIVKLDDIDKNYITCDNYYKLLTKNKQDMHKLLTINKSLQDQIEGNVVIIECQRTELNELKNKLDLVQQSANSQETVITKLKPEISSRKNNLSPLEFKEMEERKKEIKEVHDKLLNLGFRTLMLHQTEHWNPNEDKTSEICRL